MPTEDEMRSARPLLVTRVVAGERTPDGGQEYTLYPMILDQPLEWDEVERESYSAVSEIGGAPAYRRVIRIGDEWFSLTTTQIPRHSVMKGWGKPGIARWKKDGGIVQIMTLLPPPSHGTLQ